MQLSIIIPAFNEEQRLPQTLQRILEYLKVHFRGSYELIVVNDGSGDGTADVVKGFQRNYSQIRLISLEKNQGRGAAFRRAVFESHGEFILDTDADGSVNEHAIIDFVNYLLRNANVDVLTGSRTVKGSRILTPQPLLRKITGYCFFFLTRIFFNWPVMDRVNSFKMYRRDAAIDIFEHQYEDRFISKAEVIFVAEQRGWTVKELPILWTEYSGSKVRPLRDSVDSIGGLLRIVGRQRQGVYKRDIKKRDVPSVNLETRKEYDNILITGGHGFMGSNYIRLLYNTHPFARIVNLDLLTYAANRDNLRDVEQVDATNKNPRYQFIHGDICDESLLEKIFSEHKFDLVVHFAAESHVDRSIVGSAAFIKTNIEGTRALMDAARKHKTRRFIHISTDEIYGSYRAGYADEEWPLRPSNPYAASKAGADHLVQSYIRTHNMPAVIIRGSNNYGPYQYPEKLIPLAITNLLDGQKIPIHGYGEQVRSWVHVDDFCHAVDLVAHGNPQYNIYNVSGEEKSVMEVLELIARYLDKRLEDHRFHVTNRPGQDMRYAVDASLLSNDLGWTRTQNSFEAAIKNVIGWYVQNRQWWQAVKQKEGFQVHINKQAKGLWS